jgi:hypothetical protein
MEHAVETYYWVLNSYLNRWSEHIYNCFFNIYRLLSVHLRVLLYSHFKDFPQMSVIVLFIYPIQNYWVFGLFPSSGILEIRKYDFSKTGYVSVLRQRGKTPTQLGPLKDLTSITGQPLSDSHSYLIIWDQANSAGDNEKVCNKNCDRARACVEVG